jgi:hypothetical protein
LLAADDYQIADPDRTLGQQDHARDEIVDQVLQAKTNADRQRAGNDGEIGEVEAGIGEGRQRRDQNADIADACFDGIANAARNPGGLQHPRVEPARNSRAAA